MNKNPIYIGSSKVHKNLSEVKGNFISIDNEDYYKISNSSALRPFFMSIVSDSNHWMFISSNGGLTAGRKDCDTALFPYYTDDKITESVEITGSKTILQVHIENKTFLWEPFSERHIGVYNINRNLYKNSYGNKIIFEEINNDLGITFRYQWSSSNQFGFVKKSTLINITNTKKQVTVLDGIQNIMPYGLTADLQNTRSNLVDAYKKNELQQEVGLGIYALSAIIVDKAEPSEALKSTIVWSVGLDKPTYLLSSLQLDDFRKGKTLQQEIDIKAEKGAYFICKELSLTPQVNENWMLVANVNQSIVSINQISDKIKNEKNLSRIVQQDIDSGTKLLLKLSGVSDGIQLTDDKLRNTRHFSNTLFNIMRGGVFDENYQIEKVDFVKYLASANKKVFETKEKLLQKLPAQFSLKYLREITKQDKGESFKRLCFEYMPLKFSRRHGDPSRPWNKFSINTKSELDGSKVLDYEGNWRDIFQNWEALVHSYPDFIENMIYKFLNATTFEGYNPYRVTKDGFDWEVVDENDPWSYIGYWGDHQIIYLLKFLEFIEKYDPNKLSNYFDKDLFVYANVPYKIKSYDDTITNPKDTIVFDKELDRKINKRKIELGSDGALLCNKNLVIYNVNFIEKILATILAKYSNFIPEAGIWLNTQRPEWNDANNALVGNGVSMVTLCYLRRFMIFFNKIISNSTINKVSISEELIVFFNEIVTTLDKFIHVLSGKISDTERKSILDGLGKAGSIYRTTIYKNAFSGKKETLTISDLKHFLEIAIQYLNHSIDANKRIDNLYHSYNLITLEKDNEIVISNLPEMLEGQVAVLSSGYMSSFDCLHLLDNLKNSALFRSDQYSYLLYPNKDLPRFVDKNNISTKAVEKSKLLKELIKNKNFQIIEKDSKGGYHFNGNFNNANSLKLALNQLPEKQYKSLIEKDTKLLLDIFENVFDHKSFTGRSGTFFGYEGLGSIYWHMVSKLALAVQECCLKAIEDKESDELIGRLLTHYYEINEGLGVHKSPKLYGAFPIDPYSHTPFGKGAQQPGMTGQVKEDILNRFGELGVFVKNGRLEFKPNLLRKEEFLKESRVFKYIDVLGQVKEIGLEKNSLCFTYCQIPIIYKLSNKSNSNIEVIFSDKTIVEFDRLSLNQSISQQIFERNGEVDQICVLLNEKGLYINKF
jgi:hypothetical protein